MDVIITWAALHSNQRIMVLVVAGFQRTCKLKENPIMRNFRDLNSSSHPTLSPKNRKKTMPTDHLKSIRWNHRQKVSLA